VQLTSVMRTLTLFPMTAYAYVVIWPAVTVKAPASATKSPAE
jgi:hypothetical protein